ncbi:L-ascorbate metabolism protein UlaG (beta-lactamase superfamily) [Allocatelliglobosispora scoriae]|uniref:L-ascorbate metabolism protein UlaG (Beta-lactamase superfamily) n=1 Tax=Allocatelliglobosispora scoriae TaxID=643052 RepID=A0A841BLA7_9ACTN|nr:MBL fold metallo-hydrolase [Allocatelliglobosispora scoriae]MBB5869877.1 L-ascorbate metabolism protein UlaG (beta-lactamase superfamily) [Allocatelliglobosispora scoriae]
MQAKTVGLLAVAAAAVGAAAWAFRDIPAAMGARPSPDRVRRSPQYRDGTFHNTATTRVAMPDAKTMREFLLGGQRREPTGRVPVVPPRFGAGQSPDSLHITWYGHASVLVELEGARVLIDPIWSDRCSPSGKVGPKRLHPVPVALEEIPPLDAILISHDHYDHLDMATVKALTVNQTAPFLVPLGVGAHLHRWGVPAHRIIELDWAESVDIAGLHLVATEAQHFSGRGLTRNGTLWSSWVIAGKNRRVFYTGDSGYFAGYAEIGAKYGPFDVTLMQIGAYDKAWPDIHMFPEEAIQAHLELVGGLLIPVHWATFNLALHSWSEPPDRLWAEAKARGVTMAVPKPGERVDAADPPPIDGWWQSIA